ncbi:MAG: response regulator [Verrucomicrobia bacterium]|nr:response regulator [Verrucomicrobiota bacterium]
MSTTTASADAPVEILVVEDSPTQAQRLQHILEQQGYHVTVAANGREALAAAEQRKPTLIISDVVMPVMDGYQLCRHVKGDDGLGETPVILVTTLSDPHDVIRGLECRADNFILKPYDERYLLGRVQFVLVNREMRRAEQSGMGVEICFNGQKHFITADRLQILNLLLSTYEAAIQRNRELTRTQEELHRLNAELAAANQELEAFSYSVSHDLRAPLRAIDGFSQALVEDGAEKLDERSQGHLQRVRAATQRMGELIDDLLNLARVSRAQMHQRHVDLSDLGARVADGLRRTDPERQVEIVIASGLVANGDPRLLQVVLENLLGNAWKFTSKQPNARIELGLDRSANPPTFFLRDNGAGFDMTYAGKLFGAFQRLHSASEFPGTGVGLATVQRVIHRHGGRIWAEAEVGKGATFYFTLQT